MCFQIFIYPMYNIYFPLLSFQPNSCVDCRQREPISSSCLHPPLRRNSLPAGHTTSSVFCTATHRYNKSSCMFSSMESICSSCIRHLKQIHTDDIYSQRSEIPKNFCGHEIHRNILAHFILSATKKEFTIQIELHNNGISYFGKELDVILYKQKHYS